MNNETFNRVIFIEGEKLNLRPLCELDADRLVLWINDPQVRKYLTVYLPMTIEKEREWIKSISGSDKNIVFAVINKKDNEHIGNMGLHNINWRNGTATFGFMIGNKKYWGNKHGTEMLELMLEYAFNELDLRKIKSSVLELNTFSKDIHKKCGFKEVGVFKREYFVDNKHLDEILFEIFKKDWVKIKK